MSALNFALRFSCAAVAFGLLACPTQVAAQTSNLPVATGISPGDIVISDFGNDWFKFDPTANQLFSLPWDHRFSTDEKFVFDNDGAILQLSRGTTSGGIVRIHPVTGNVTRSGPTWPTFVDFDIAANGDLILARRATSAQKNGDIWSGGTDGRIYVYSRSNEQILPVPKPQHFSPWSVDISPAGDVFIGEFFRDLAKVSLPSGTVTPIASPDDPTTAILDVFINGDLLIATPLLGKLSRLDPVTGIDIPLFNGATPLLFQDATVDDQGNIWLVDRNGLNFVDGLTGTMTMRSPSRFLSNSTIAIVPADWTPPPIPEPATCAMTAFGLLALAAVRRRRN